MLNFIIFFAFLSDFILNLVDTVYKYRCCTEEVTASLKDVEADTSKFFGKNRQFVFSYTFAYNYGGTEYLYNIKKPYSFYEADDNILLRIDPQRPYYNFVPYYQKQKLKSRGAILLLCIVIWIILRIIGG